MEGFATIGALYMLYINGKESVYAVIENNLNDNKTILVNVEIGPSNGQKISVDASKLNSREPIGPILPINGETVIENGRQFIKQPKSKTKR